MIDSRPANDGKVITRRRGCRCGARWTTHETRVGDTSERALSGWMIEKGRGNGKQSKRRRPGNGPLPAVVAEVENPPPAVHCATTGSGSNETTPPPPAVVDPPPAVVAVSEGGISSLFLPLPVLADQDPDPPQAKPQPGDRARGKPYAAAFLAFWDAIESPSPMGMKRGAFERWAKVGKPAAELLIAKWNEYLAGLGDTYAMHVARWLGERGWEQSYGPPPPRRPTSGLHQRRQQLFDDVTDFGGGK